MARKSSIQALPEELLAELEALWGSGRYTLDQMVERLRAMGAEVSRSALGRQTQKWDERLARIRTAREMSRAWKAAIAEDPEGDVSRILGEQLNIMAFDLTERLDNDELGLKDMAALAKMARDLAQMGKHQVDREAASRTGQAGPLEVINAFVQRLTDAITAGRPELAEAFLEVMEPVAADLAKDFA